MDGPEQRGCGSQPAASSCILPRFIIFPIQLPLPSMISPVLQGAVLLGHGSREPGTEAEIRELADTLRHAAPAWHFTHAFLNQEPKLDGAVEALAREGCRTIRVLPLLVFTGRHMLEDVPAEITRLRALHPETDIRLERHLYRLPGFAALLAQTLTLNAPPAKDTPA